MKTDLTGVNGQWCHGVEKESDKLETEGDGVAVDGGRRIGKVNSGERRCGGPGQRWCGWKSKICTPKENASVYNSLDDVEMANSDQQLEGHR